MTRRKAKSTEETIKATGETLLAKVKELIAKGNVRHISIKDKNNKTIVEFPMTLGVVAAALTPMLAAIGALAALIGECTISVEREEK